MNWSALLKTLAPVVGEVASSGQSGHFLQGFQEAQERKRLRLEQETQRKQTQAKLGADYLLRIGEHAQGIEDPTDFENFLSLAEDAGVSAGYTEPGKLRGSLKFNNTKLAEKQLKEITAHLNQLKQDGYNLDDLAASNPPMTLDLGGGKSLPIATALEMTRRRPTQGGQPVPAPKPVVKPPDRSLVESQFDDLIALWKDQNPGKEPPADIRTRLRQQAQKEIGQADDRPRSAGSEQSLVSVTETDPDTGEQVTSLVPRRPGEVSRKPPAQPSQGQFTAAGYAGRMEQADPILTSLTPSVTGMNVISYETQLKLPAALQSADMQSYMQASRNFINAVLRRESGAVISPSEFEEARKQYLPQPGDTPETTQQKAQNRAYVTQTIKRASGRAYEAPLKPPAAGGAPQDGDTKEIPGFPGTEQTYKGGKWIRTK